MTANQNTEPVLEWKTIAEHGPPEVGVYCLFETVDGTGMAKWIVGYRQRRQATDRFNWYSISHKFYTLFDPQIKRYMILGVAR